MTSTEQALSTVCTAMMTAVARSGVLDKANDATLTSAVAIMRAEIKALLFGPEYADERAVATGAGNLSSVVVASVAASCILKIKAAR
jgi:hypothetical protein